MVMTLFLSMPKNLMEAQLIHLIF
ncbi:uncharacterized protein METZ01_LOCUS288749 [marine metagenome]|uniref:Uncharacterized protein n=1 Tax=marine metagenome TaxID=408172 RepID=A0A382LJ85_9ZZZZ